MAKQFLQTLKGIAFYWYTNLEPETIDSCGQMEQEFLQRFYSAKRTVSMSDLTNTKQWKDESVVDYINRWRAVSLECKGQLSEASAVEMCTQGMAWDLFYVLQMSKPRTFQGLATKAHDMEVIIASRRDSSLSFSEPRRDQAKVKKSVKFFTNSTKEVMAISKARLVRI